MTVTFNDSAFLRDLDRQLARVERGCEVGIGDVARDIAEGTRARLAASDPDAAQTVSVHVRGGNAEVLVRAWDAGLLEFGTVNNAPRPAMRPAIVEAEARAEKLIKRSVPQS